MSVCIPVRSTFAARCSAIRQVIRPGDVTHYAAAGLAHAHHRHANEVEGIACYLRQLGLVYIADPQRRDFWCPPLETIRRGGGDCDDFSILAASVLRAASYRADVVLGWWRQPKRRGYHAWVVGVARCGRCRFVLEPQTGEVWWHEIPADRDAEFVIAPEQAQCRCARDVRGSSGHQERDVADRSWARSTPAAA